MSLRHVVDPALLYSNYHYATPKSSLISDHMRRVADIPSQRFGLPSNGLVVEFGSNVGVQLEKFRQKGFRVLGVDPAENLAGIASSRGIETLADYFTPDVASRILSSHGPASLVLGRQSFEHIDDVHEVVNASTTLLSANGILSVEVPYLLDLIESCQFDTVFHERLSYFSLTSLNWLFEAHGLRTVDVERVSVHGGAITVFAARAESEHETRSTVDELLSLEITQGLRKQATYDAFAKRVDNSRKAVYDTVRSLRAQGSTVAAYGASVRGSSLLFACELGPQEVRFCSDPTPSKWGKFLPGSGIPIRSTEEAQSDPPDYYLVLAWNYIDEILVNERAYLNAGGRFIVPIPEPRIIALGGGAESVLC